IPRPGNRPFGRSRSDFLARVFCTGQRECPLQGRFGPVQKVVGGYYALGSAIVVNLQLEMRAPSSLVILISQSCVVLPLWIKEALAYTYPWETDFTWLAAISIPRI